MSTNTNNSTNTTLGSSSFMDQALNLNLMQNLIKPTGSNSCLWSTVANYILLIGQDQFKALFKAITDKVAEEIKKSNLSTLASVYDLAYSLISKVFNIFKPFVWIVRRIKSFFSSKQEQQMIPHIEAYDNFEPQQSFLCFPMEFKQCFWQAILKPKFSNILRYDQSIIGLSQKDKNTLITNEKFSNVVLKSTDFEARLMSSLEFKFANTSGSKAVESLTSIKKDQSSLFSAVDYYDYLENYKKVRQLYQNITSNQVSITGEFFFGNELSEIIKKLSDEVYGECLKSRNVQAISETMSKNRERIYFLKSKLPDPTKERLELLDEINFSNYYKSDDVFLHFQKAIKTLYNVECPPTMSKLLDVLDPAYFHVVSLYSRSSSNTWYIDFCVLTMLIHKESRDLIKKIFTNCEKSRFASSVIDDSFNSTVLTFKYLQKNTRKFYFLNIPTTEHWNIFGYLVGTANELERSTTGILEAKVSIITRLFDSLPKPYRGADGLKAFVNHLFRSSSFKELPFKEDQTTSKDVSQSIDIYIKSSTISDKLELQNKFINFCQNICDQTVSEDEPLNKVNVYTISIAREEVITNKINPAFDTWKQQYDLLKDLDQKDPNVVNQLANLSSSKPSENIEITSIKKSIKSTSINTVQKDLATMYLSKKDKTTLLSLLHTFKNNKKKFEKLGLPNKLGVLLHGLPGCGKTSTVTAIATYLQKDIYYLNLNGVKTNEELSMLFDYVVKETTTSGIIVMEDIDAMTKVVHKRNYEEKSALTTVDLIDSNESPLTLEYFLNILQGTLTRENSVFIATTNHIEMLDPAFYRPGRFDIKIEMKPADHYQIEQIFQTFFERPISNENLRKIPEYKYTPAQFIFKFAEFIVDPNVSDDEILREFYN